MRTAIVVMCLLLAACSTASGTSGPGGGPLPKTVTAGWSDKGRSLSVHQGDTVRVQLQSTFWHFRPVAGGAVSRGTIAVHPAHGPVTIRGSGRGTVIATFHARKAGTAHITAGRSSCGEALRCVGGQDLFTLTVVVG